MSDVRISSNTTIQRADGLLHSYLGDEILMMSISHGKYFNMNSGGSRIWELLEYPTTVEKLVVALTDEYEVAQETVQQAVDNFLIALQERKLLAFPK